MKVVLVGLCVLIAITFAQDCYRVVDAKKNKILYEGDMSITRTGRNCQRWDSQTPHTHSRTPQNFPRKDLRENYCRDPDNFGYPWCFTEDVDKKRERCAIPACEDIEDEILLPLEPKVDAPTDCYRVEAVPGSDEPRIVYGGTVNTTIRGIACQKWTEQDPVNHDRTPENFPNTGLGDHNYCRDPDSTGYPWCYTTTPGIRWEGCAIPNCDNPFKDNCVDLDTGESYPKDAEWFPEPCKRCQCFEDRLVDCQVLDCPPINCPNGVSYLNGKCCPVCSEECMDLNTGDIYEVGDSWIFDKCSTCSCKEDENGEKQEVCEVTECPPLDEGCEPLIIPGKCCPVCSEECRKEENNGYYELGDTWKPDPCTSCSCDSWAGQKREMCAVIMCDIPTHCYNIVYDDKDTCCPYCAESGFSECYDMDANNTILYDGTVSTTESGKTCQFWSSQEPHKHIRTKENFPDALIGYHNYCRDPDNSGYLWCFTNDTETRWEKCDVPACRVMENPHNWDLEDAEVQNTITCEGDIGRVECTNDKRIVVTEANFGVTEDFGCVEFDGKVCESIDNTTSIVKAKCDGMSFCDLAVLSEGFQDNCPGVRKYLNISYYCEPEVPCYTVEFGYAIYDGMRSETKSGIECQRWNLKRPHGHYFSPEEFASRGIGSHNYCRDPDGEGKPWCFTMDPKKRWDFCAVEECEGYTEIPNIVAASQAQNIIRLIGDAKNINCQYIKEGEKQVTYRGKTNTTESGKTCQRWSETTPHFQTKLADSGPDAGLGDHNYCRDPDKDGVLWCYTMDENTRLEKCNVPECDDAAMEDLAKCDDVDCGSGGECFLDIGGNTACLCGSGYYGYNNTCHDIDECRRSAHVCPDELAECANTDGSYECICPDGFYYDSDTCINKTVVEDTDNENCKMPEFIKTPYNRYDVKLQDEVIIDCEADNNDTVYWTKGIDKEEVNNTRGVRSSQLTFEAIDKKEIDIYTCVILNECTGLSKSVSVDIHAKVEPCSEKGLQQYGMVWDAKTWDSAYEFCDSYGLKFAAPKSKMETRMLIQDAWKSYHSNPNAKKFKTQNWIWIAANDRMEENEFTDADGVKIMAPKWWPDNPDNWKGLDPRGQDEVAFHLYAGYWDDSYGFIPRPFACECSSTAGNNEA